MANSWPKDKDEVEVNWVEEPSYASSDDDSTWRWRDGQHGAAARAHFSQGVGAAGSLSVGRGWGHSLTETAGATAGWGILGVRGRPAPRARCAMRDVQKAARRR
jgi:hypothetical protein